MSIPGSSSPLFFQTAAAGAASTRTLQKSVRFNQDDSAYLNRTPSSAGNRKTWTFSMWFKPGTFDDLNGGILLNAQNGTTQNFANNFWILYYANQLVVGDGSTDFAISEKLRDPSAWYHFVVACDTTQSTASDRLKVYINGVEASLSTDGRSSISQNSDTTINSTFLHQIGNSGSFNNYGEGYYADMYLIDGSALDPTSFGAFDDSGVWQAAAYSGTFGTNGFHLFDFENESGIGNDSSGNDNDFNVNNISEVVPTGNYTVTRAQYTVGVGDQYDPYASVDGSLATGDSYADRGYNNNGLSFSGLPQATQSIRINCNIGGGTTTLNANHGSGDVRTFSASATDTGIWKTISGTISSSSPYTLTKITADGGNNTTSFFALYAIEIDGVIIVDNRFGRENDVLRDVPTNSDTSDTGVGGEVSGNYATWNPLSNGLGCSVTQGNLQLSGAATSAARILGTMGVSSGKWYFEVTYTATDSYTLVGVGQYLHAYYKKYPGQEALSYAFDFFQGKKYHNGSQTTHGSSLSEGDIFMCALDLDNNKVFFGKNGTFFGSGNPATGANPSYTIYAGTYYIVGRLNPAGFSSNNAIIDLNAGQRSYAYNAPSGFKSWNTSNLPDTTFAEGSKAFKATAYSGTGSTITVSTSFQPDLIWTKCRSTSTGHVLQDRVNGITSYYLQTQATDLLQAGTQGVTSTSATGYTLGTGGGVNGSGKTFRTWAWDAGSGTSTTTNTVGQRTSTVKVSQEAGISIVKWTGTSGSGGTVGHGLGAAPEFIIAHRLGGGQWPCYTKDGGAGKYMYFNSDIDERSYSHFWGGTEPTSTVFTTGSDTDVTNGNIIAYCFTPIPGFSAMGYFSGNNSTDGVYVPTDFAVAWVMTKNKSASGSWLITDIAGSPHNVADEHLASNSTNGESSYSSSGYQIDLLSNGFKLRGTGAARNGNEDAIFYLAFAANPFKANGGLAR